MTDDLLSELRAIYAVEAAEHLATLNQTLLAFETTRDSGPRRQQLETLERAAHSLKGASRAVALPLVESVAHRMENVFEAVMHGELMFVPTVADTLYDALDTLDALLSDESLDIEPILTALDALRKLPGDAPSSALAVSPARQKHDSQVIETPVEPQASWDGDPRSTVITAPAADTIRVAIARLDDLMANASDLLVERGGLEQRTADVRNLRKEHLRWQKEWRGVRTLYIRAIRAARMVSPDTVKPINAAASEWPPLLKFLTGTQEYMARSGAALEILERALLNDSLRVGVIADALNENIRRARLVPFETHLALLQRTVRDVARGESKEIRLEVSGAALQMDKRVLEAIKDPLIHLLRNAVDHGIEAPSRRRSLGKPPTGTITLSVAQRGGAVTVTVADDGAGIDVLAVRGRARRIRSTAEVEALSDAEALLLVMLPGLSTSDGVTAISGRGVGLDVVRQNIEGLQGRVAIESIFGVGTTFRLTLPISLSTLHCLLVRVGTETYAIPTTAVEQIVSPAASDLFTAGGRLMLHVGRAPIPAVALAEVLERPGSESPRYALIVASAERRIALRVDDLITEGEMVVKPLRPELSNLRNIIGATLLGTGEVVIILNINELVKTIQGTAASQVMAIPTPIPTGAAANRILIVDDSITTRTLEKNILEAAGFEVITATNGMEALDKLATVACALVVTDVEMPVMDGLELTRRIRSNERLAALPVIVVTSLDAPEQRARGLEVGADHYIVKGAFDQGELLQIIRQLL